MDINLESQIKLFNNLASFPTIGSDKTIYIDKSNGNQYYWSGTAYVQLKDSTKFPQPTGTTSEYIRGDGSLQTFPTIPDVSGKQDVPIVVDANITAVNDGNYTVVANATFTDPTPAAGKGFRVFVRNGTAVVGGISYAVAGTEIVRLFHSGSWANYTNITDLSGLVPQTRTINGLDLSADRTLTTAEINDSTDKRYVTDAQLTVIGNTSGTNTGDETQSSILSKLGFFIHKQPAPNPTVTGSAETIIGSVNIGNNKLSTSDKLIIDSDFVKTNLGTATLRYYLAPNSNNLIGATQIAFGPVIASSIFVPTFPRVFNIENGNLSGYNFGVQALVPINTTFARSSVAFNPSDTRYLITTVTFANASETGYLNSQIIKNF